MNVKIMNVIKNYRFWAMWVGAAAVVFLYWITDPDGGAETMQRLQSLVWGIVFCGAVYIARRALMDGARGKEAYDKALKHPIGAGLVFVGLCILAGLLFLGFSTRARADEPPAAARHLLPILKDEQLSRWADHPAPAVLGALVEQETCPSLTSRKCWNPRAELRTEREDGFGLGQKTIAYRADGSERFNAYRETRDAHAADLSDWTWANRYDAKLQLRALVLDNRDCYRKLSRLIGAGEDALAMCDSAYNGGYGGVLDDRRLCASVPGCDPKKWFGHVAIHSTKSRVKWRGYGASAYDINRTHVDNVIHKRRGRYIAALEA